jgi:hypothetical protein
MKLVHLIKSSELSNVIMSKYSYRNLTLAMSTGEFHMHQYRLIEVKDAEDGMEYTVIADDGSLILPDDWSMDERTLALGVSIAQAENRSDMPKGASKPKCHLKLVHSSGLDDLDQIKINMRRFDRRSLRLAKLRRDENNRTKKLERIK